jgi:uncharacterized SAM-binding protein YcdF (DUF218 family)
MRYSAIIDGMSFWAAPLNALFDSLSAGEAPRAADVLFVFAGRPERKRYGIELWKRGLAPTLVLSVGRYEWRRFPELGLPDDGGLVDLVQRTPPPERHFFVVLDRSGVSTHRVDARGLGTWNEARQLAAFLAPRRFRSVLVVSTSIHLRRSVETLRGLALNPALRIHAAPVPERESSIRREDWWKTLRPRRAVLFEGVKLVLYRMRLWMRPARQRREGSASSDPVG